MARNGTQVMYYLDDESVEFIKAKASKIGISRSKVIKRALAIWRDSDRLMLENFGERIPSPAEMAAWVIEWSSPDFDRTPRQR